MRPPPPTPVETRISYRRAAVNKRTCQREAEASTSILILSSGTASFSRNYDFVRKKESQSIHRVLLFTSRSFRRVCPRHGTGCAQPRGPISKNIEIKLEVTQDTAESKKRRSRVCGEMLIMAVILHYFVTRHPHARRRHASN